jgi:hypothetical protein
MQPETVAELSAVMRGVPAGTPGTLGTTRVALAQPPGTSSAVPAQKGPLFHVFHMFQVEQDTTQKAQLELGTAAQISSDADTLAERAAIAIEDGFGD